MAKKCYSGKGDFGDVYLDYYYIYNGHGDVVAMADKNGNIVNEYSYDPWGKILSETETVNNSIKYAGEYYDKETGEALETQTQYASILLNFRFFGLSVLQGVSLAAPLRTKKAKIFLI